ncbi:hypothetical protein [Desulfomonile tiedjei]|uniref:Uncharacterized protein n=1 Tax=Desulfomonile tiedjei (strain ATCC 49306 / DSM 6799 / DCB-1) TaxID=706587 RepID=I4CAB4_DESTA|nr:hypothetical protein [Desulfomonile tiedjei]AFM26505.1 hypothetical protein Desti_3863 [Desulfomonile tiedjei DSM 6799]
MPLSEANRIVDARAFECLSLRAKRNNPLKVQASIRRLSHETRDRSASRDDMSPNVAPPWVIEGTLHQRQPFS